MARSASVRVEVFADLHADVGEAPHWDERTKTLLFVDLTAGVVFRYDQSGAKLGSFSVGQEVGAVVPRRSGGLVLAVRDGIAAASDTGEGFELTAPVERDIPGNRMNDAKCDPAGRLLAGTTAFDFSPHSAALYRVEPDWSFERIVRDVTQSNGIAWSPSGSRMYFIDSATQGVDVFDYHVGTGSAGNRKRLVTIERAHGVPDGMTTDNRGNLWVACFGWSSGPLLFTSRCATGRGSLSGYPGDELYFRRFRSSGPVCDLGCLPAEHRSAEERAACGCDIRMPSRGGGHVCVVVRRVNDIPLITKLPPTPRNPVRLPRKSC